MVIDSDTVVVMTTNQLEKVNFVKVDRDRFKTLYDSLRTVTNTANITIISLEETVRQLEQALQDQGNLDHAQRQLIRDLDKEARELGVENEKLKQLLKYAGGGIAILILVILILL